MCRVLAHSGPLRHGMCVQRVQSCLVRGLPGHQAQQLVTLLGLSSRHGPVAGERMHEHMLGARSQTHDYIRGHLKARSFEP